MGHVELHSVGVVLPDRRPLLHDVSFRAGGGTKTRAGRGNGAGKTTLLRVVAGDAEPVDGRVSCSGGLGSCARSSAASTTTPACATCCWPPPHPASGPLPPSSTRRSSLEAALASYDGTVVAVTHDRWSARSFDRFLVLGADGVVVGTPEPVWHEGRVRRAR